MNSVYKTLVKLDFPTILFEASAQTTTGQDLINKYKKACMMGETTCAMVNNFIREAKDFTYDSGVAEALGRVSDVLNANKYSWAISSACESIQANKSTYNYLARNAAEKVMPILEMEEDEVVQYIKSGAFKSVMHVEQFRNIAKSIYKDQPIVEYIDNFKASRPISMVEDNEDVIFFEVLGNIYKIQDKLLYEAKANEVSDTFITISQLLESNMVSLDTVNETVTLNFGNKKYEVSNQDEVTLISGDNKKVMTASQLRENNNLYISALPNTASKYNQAAVLEALAKLVENFDKVHVMDNVYVIESQFDKFFIIENDGKAVVKSIVSGHNVRLNEAGDITEVLNTVKKQTKVDLTEKFSEAIGKNIRDAEETEAKQIQESLEESQNDQRRQKIAELTQRYKNDPAKLAVLSKIASELNAL